MEHTVSIASMEYIQRLEYRVWFGEVVVCKEKACLSYKTEQNIFPLA